MPSNAAKIRKKKEERKKLLDAHDEAIKKLTETDKNRVSKVLEKHGFFDIELSDKQLNELAKRMVDAALRLSKPSSDSPEGLVGKSNNQHAVEAT